MDPPARDYDFNSFSAYGSDGYPLIQGSGPFDLPIHRQIRALQLAALRRSSISPSGEGISNYHHQNRSRDDWKQTPGSWVHAPPSSFYPPLPDGYNYVKDPSVTLKGKLDQMGGRRDGVYQVPWARDGIHDLYVMSLWTVGGLVEKLLIIQETEMKDKVEEWTSIWAAMEEKTTYIVCEPPQIGWKLCRFNIVGNYVHRMVIKSCLWTLGASIWWPHKTLWYWPSFLLAGFGVLIYQDIRKDPCSNYQVVKDPYLISRFPLCRLASGKARILRFESHEGKWWWQKFLLTLTSLQLFYRIIYPSPPCVCG